MPEEVPGCPGVHVVDTELFGTPGFMSAYVVDADRPAVVDPGAATGVDRVLAALSDLGIARDELAYVVPTHVHLDHAGAAGALADACPGATVACHERGIDYLTDPDRLQRLVESARRAIGGAAEAYGDPDPVSPDRARAVTGGDGVDLGDRALRVVDAPGHAPHQACLLDARTGGLFAGDAAGMFRDGDLHPTTPPPDFDLAASLATVDRLREHDPAALLYAHFGPRDDGVTADDALADYADLLVEFVEAVEGHREAGDDAGAVLAALPDRWGGPTAQADVAGVLRYLDGRE